MRCLHLFASLFSFMLIKCIQFFSVSSLVFHFISLKSQRCVFLLSPHYSHPREKEEKNINLPNTECECVSVKGKMLDVEWKLCQMAQVFGHFACKLSSGNKLYGYGTKRNEPSSWWEKSASSAVTISSWQGNECVGALPTRILSIIHSWGMEQLICGKRMQTEATLLWFVCVTLANVVCTKSNEKLSRINQLVKCLWHACECVWVGENTSEQKRPLVKCLFCLSVWRALQPENWIEPTIKRTANKYKHTTENTQPNVRKNRMYAEQEPKKFVPKINDRMTKDYMPCLFFLSHSIFFWHFLHFRHFFFLFISSRTHSRPISSRPRCSFIFMCAGHFEFLFALTVRYYCVRSFVAFFRALPWKLFASCALLYHFVVLK